MQGPDQVTNGLLQLVKRLAAGCRPINTFRIMAYPKAGKFQLEGDTSPVRISSDSNLPKHSFNTTIIPEFSQWFDTEKFIPKAEIITDKGPEGLTVSIRVATIPNSVYAGEKMPSGVMPWGDYNAIKVPYNDPAGTIVLGRDGLFIPMLLTSGHNSLSLTFTDATKAF